MGFGPAPFVVQTVIVTDKKTIVSIPAPMSTHRNTLP